MSKGESPPLVSVLIPAYKSIFFEECLESALNQTYHNLEIIVSDDCPSFEIEDIVKTKEDPRIRYYRNIPAKGPALNYPEVFKLAKGEYIKFLNDDDILHQSCIEKMLPYLLLSSVKVVTTYRQEVDDNGNSLPDRLHNAPLFKENVLIEGSSLACAMLSNQINVVGEPTCILFRKEDVESVKPHLLCFGGYGYQRSGLGDVGLVLNLLSQGDCAYLGEEALVWVRVFEGQWQQVSDAREWSLKTWNIFRNYAIKSGLMRKMSLGRSFLCRSNENESFRRKSFIAKRDFRWFMSNPYSFKK